MQWVDGVKLTDKAAMAAAGLDIIDFVDVGIECTLRQLLEHGYFHADPHPGATSLTPSPQASILFPALEGPSRRTVSEFVSLTMVRAAPIGEHKQ